MDSSEEVVDVLMATYNTNIKYLKLQLDSIINQTYKNINIIISDDNSTDNKVKEILKQYEEKDSRIKLYFQDENLGYLKNFEFLLTKSGGEYISLADHDDIWYEDKIEKCIETINDKKVDLVYSDAKQIDENGKVINESYIKYKNMPVIKGENNILAFSRHIAIGCSQVFTKKIKESMLPFTKGMMAHDWISVYLADRVGYGVEYIEKPLFGYRLHTDNVFGGRSLKQNLGNWKQNHGKSFKSYKEYRKDAITRAYLSGVLMCKEYNEKLGIDTTKLQNNVIKYYEKCLKTKVISFRIDKYMKYLSFKGIGKRRLKEIMLFHFPIISYLVFLVK